MNFELTQEQKMLADGAAGFAKKSSPVSRFRKLREEQRGYERAVWKQMAELGWLGVALPERVGGFGGGAVELCLICEQLGQTLVPEPLLASVALAGRAIERAGDAAQQKRWLEPLAAGDAVIALAWAERQGRYDAGAVTTRAEAAGGDAVKLTGEKVFVLAGHDADQFVVSAREGAGVSLFVVDKGAAGLRVQPIKTMDGQLAAMLRLDGVKLGAGERLGAPGAGLPALEAALDLGAAVACAEGLGIMQAVLRMTVEYLKTREQFGVKIGSFQALQHRAVDMFVETELCRSTMALAAIKADDADANERKAGVSAAKAQLAMGGRLVVQQGIQLHGGIGITEEHDIGLYFKRMTVLNSICGDEEFHVARFAALPGFTAEL